MPDLPAASDSALIRARDLTKRFGTFTAVDRSASPPATSMR
jgi:hypothetical protein